MKNKRRYLKSRDVEDFAIQFYSKRGRGIKFIDLVTNGLGYNKEKAQAILKRCRQNQILFTPENLRPQMYYPTIMKSHIMKKLFTKNDQIHPSGVGSNFSQLSEKVRLHTLREFVLPLLPDTPLECHNLHLKAKVRPDFYEGIDLVPCFSSGGKSLKRSIDQALITCTVYPRGTVDIQIACSNSPFKLETYHDVMRLFIFMGQVKEFIKTVIIDPHERTIGDVLDWELTELDINKDVPISDAFHLVGLKTQAKIRMRDFEYVLRLYFKERGCETVSRAEMSLNPKLRLSEIINPLLFGLFGISFKELERKSKFCNILYSGYNCCFSPICIF